MKITDPNALKWAIVAIVLIFGDIGTSVIYLFDVMVFETKHGVSSEVAMGSVGLVFWTLLFVSTKYMLVTLEADYKGEGGIFALLNILKNGRENGFVSNSIFNYAAPISVLGACILGSGDGTLTSAISVKSAIEGLGILFSALQPYEIPITIVIIFMLFYSARWGADTVSKYLAPFMIMWFPLVGSVGLYWIIQQPTILWTLVDPRYAINFLISSGFKGALIIGGVIILAETGGEACYADLSVTTKQGIRKAWFFFVFPCIMLCYLGEGAFLLGNGNINQEKIFFSMANGNQFLLLVMVFFATIATCIASLALITGVQVLAAQANTLGYLPRMKVIHTSKDHAGQIYVPIANWTLFIATCAVLIMFGTSTKMASAYGWGVASVSLLTTAGLFLISGYKLGWSKPRAWIQLGIFLIVDIFFFASTSQKFMEGAWFPMASGLFTYFICDSWSWGRSRLRKRLNEFNARYNLLWLQSVKVSSEGKKIVVFARTRIVDCDSLLPYSIVEMVNDSGTIAQISFCNVEILSDVPNIRSEDQYTLDEVCGFNIHRIKLGFLDKTENVANILGEHVNLTTKIVLLGDEEVWMSSPNLMNNIRFAVYSFLKRNTPSAAAFLGFGNGKYTTNLRKVTKEIQI